ncbi:uncharacterized protein [Prorops nasuta]|uniref:uncharacterized protein isoform X2 n=1 Tax=Prorops nasuta TaxID=863751 RepID=UPI0034CFEB2B
MDLMLIKQKDVKTEKPIFSRVKKSSISSEMSIPEEKPKRPRFCPKCRHHGLGKFPLKNHKVICKYIACPCPQCLEVDKKREKMADQTAFRRTKNTFLDNKKIKNKLLSDSPEMDQLINQLAVTRVNHIRQYRRKPKQLTNEIWKKNEEKQLNIMPKEMNCRWGMEWQTHEDLYLFIMSSLRLMQYFHYPSQVLPALFLITQITGGDYSLAMTKLIEADVFLSQYFYSTNIMNNGLSTLTQESPTYEGPVPVIGYGCGIQDNKPLPSHIQQDASPFNTSSVP